jgi:hypothetical protein
LKTGIKLGDKMEIPAHKVLHPESGHFGEIVYVSEDGKTVTVKCEKQHDGKTVSLKVRVSPKNKLDTPAEDARAKPF